MGAVFVYLPFSIPTFELFYQEYKRLGLSVFFDPENRKPFESIKKHFGDKPQLLERLGDVLFFTSLYNQGCLGEFVNALVEKEDIYLKASGEEKLKAHQKIINYIEELFEQNDGKVSDIRSQETLPKEENQQEQKW